MEELFLNESLRCHLFCPAWINFKCQCVIYFGMVSVMGKVEGQGVKQWHGHVTAVTVSPRVSQAATRKETYEPSRRCQ